MNIDKPLKREDYKIKPITIAIDFDGTVVTNENFPSIGKDIGATLVLKKLVENGHRLVLWTVRSGKYLDPAVKWFSDNGINLHGVNKIKKELNFDSPKLNADLFIDDKALNIPLIYPEEGKPYVNWLEVSKILKKQGIL